MTERIAIYLRLSKEDNLVGDESNSISNQRDLIMRYIHRDRKLRNQEIIECIDDGYSGKNMNRPGMEKLLDLIRNRLINTLIVKDLSRFSRDYLVLGKYTEQILPFMGIRFIAINDSYDSSQCEGGIGEIDVAFKAMLYDFYSEDLSQKVKTSLRAGKEQGYFMNVYAPYGYRKDPDDHHRLLIEPEGAEVIRRIFREFIDGKSKYQIAKELNEEKVDTPAAYVQKRDGKQYVFRDQKEGSKWTGNTVGRILRNEVYVGIAVYNKAHSQEVGSHRTVANPAEEWERVERIFPAIITEEEFENAASRLESARREWPDKDPAARHFLTGKVICGGCGHAMSHSNGYQYQLPFYSCRPRFYLTDRERCVKSILDKDLEKILKRLIYGKIRSLPDIESIRREKNERMKKRIHDAGERLVQMQRSREKISRDLFQAYESFKEGLTGKETYLQQKTSYEEMMDKLSENISRQEKAISEMEVPQEGAEMEMTVPELKKHLILDRNFSDLFIRQITVYADRHIDVLWNFCEE